MLRLTMRRGPTPGAVYDLEADEITIGRGNKNSIVIRDNEVSRDHCRLVRLRDSYEVHDLDSSNGTFVNGQRVVSPWMLQPGTLIELGDTITLEFGLPVVVQEAVAVEAPASPEIPSYYSLKLTKGPSNGSIYALTEKTVTVGRDLNNDIVIQDPEVSRQHLRIQFAQNGYQVEDLGSTNGTFINEQPLQGVRCLEPDDVLRLGTMVQIQYLYHDRGLLSDEEETPHVGMPGAADVPPTLMSFKPIELMAREVSPRVTGLERGALLDHLMIVYARQDWGRIVAPLLVRLQDTRLNAWVDQYLTLGSDNWHLAVEQALDECWLMVLAVSAGSLESDHVKQVYRHFLSRSKPIILLIADADQTLPAELVRMRTIIYDANNRERTFHKLIFEIMQQRREK